MTTRAKTTQPTCGARRKKNQGLCTRPAGWGTDHVGAGKCKLHGGATPVKHGLYSSVAGIDLKRHMHEIEQSKVDIMDLSPEALLLRALLRTFVEKQDSLKDQLNKWSESFSPAFQTIITSNEAKAIAQAISDVKASINQRPRRVFDFEAAARLAENLGRMVERIHKMKQTSALTWESVALLHERMGMILLKHGRRWDGKQFNWKAFWAEVERDWGSIDVTLTGGKA